MDQLNGLDIVYFAEYLFRGNSNTNFCPKMMDKSRIKFKLYLNQWLAGKHRQIDTVALLRPSLRGMCVQGNLMWLKSHADAIWLRSTLSTWRRSHGRGVRAVTHMYGGLEEVRSLVLTDSVKNLNFLQQTRTFLL